MPGQHEPISRSFSLYLDLVRFLAAFAVFLDHLTSYPFTRDEPGPRTGVELIGNYGQTAVTLFFVLSGYVIAYVSETREKSPRSYVASRISRLYSVVVPALILTVVLDTFGTLINPDFYQIRKILYDPPSVQGYVASLFFVNEYQIFPFRGLAPGSNGPFWSLSFEATYYLVAGLLLFSKRTTGVAISLLVLFCAGSTIVALAPLWALGFYAFRRRDQLDRLIRLPYLLWLGSGFMILAIPLLMDPIRGDIVGLSFPFGRGLLERDLGKDYATAFACAIHLVASRAIFADRVVLKGRNVRSIRFLGVSTFPLYAMHFPILAFAAAVGPGDRSSAWNAAYLTIAVVLSVGLITPVCELLKVWMRNALRYRGATKLETLPVNATTLP
jgi:peptidoglycan/LPS O-acetylase OafA/YrhL